jgi:serine/threonine protein kinase
VEQLFRGRDAAHTLELVKRGRIPRPTLLNPSYPKKLEPIVLKALERDPAQRFQTAEELEYELSSYLIDEHKVVSHRSSQSCCGSCKVRGSRSGARPSRQSQPTSMRIARLAVSLNASRGSPTSRCRATR